MRPVLLIDDDADDLAILRAELEPLGCELVTAADGQEALRLIRQRDFALVVIDLMLPLQNGFQVGSLLRERAPGLDIVILTGFDEDGARALEGWRPGAFELMRKPMPPEVLRARVARAGDGARAR